jgi:hypothetical protein
MTYTTDRSKDGKKSLRFRTSLRDEEHYKKNRTEWGSFGGTQGGYDLSQGSWRTAMVTISLMNNLENLQERKDVTELADRIRNEIARGLEWLLKTRFGDGYLILIFL